MVGTSFVGEELTFEEAEEMAMLGYGVVRLEKADAELIKDELETETNGEMVALHGPPGQTHL